MDSAALVYNYICLDTINKPHREYHSILLLSSFKLFQSCIQFIFIVGKISVFHSLFILFSTLLEDDTSTAFDMGPVQTNLERAESVDTGHS